MQEILRKQMQNFPIRRSVNERGYDEWSYLVRGLSYIEVIDEKQERRLEEELALIKETGIADFFWFIHSVWSALYYNGGGYITGEMEKFYCLYMLEVTKTDPSKALPDFSFLQNGLPTVNFVTSKGKGEWLLKYIKSYYGAQTLKKVEDQTHLYRFGDSVTLKITEEENV